MLPHCFPRRELRQLEARLKSSSEAADKYEVKYMKTQEHLEVWRDNIHALFAKSGCNRASVAEVLGNQGVTDTNVMQYMGACRCCMGSWPSVVPLTPAPVVPKRGSGIIEQRINEVVNLYLQSREGTNDGLAHTLRLAKEGNFTMGVAAAAQRELFSKTTVRNRAASGPRLATCSLIVLATPLCVNRVPARAPQAGRRSCCPSTHQVGTI